MTHATLRSSETIFRSFQTTFRSSQSMFRSPQTAHNDLFPIARVVVFEFINDTLRVCGCGSCLRSVVPYVNLAFGLTASALIATIHGRVLANHAVPTSAPQIQVCASSPVCPGSRLIDIAAAGQSQRSMCYSCCPRRFAETHIDDEGPSKDQAKAEGKNWCACAKAKARLAPDKSGYSSAWQRRCTKLFCQRRCLLPESRYS